MSARARNGVPAQTLEWWEIAFGAVVRLHVVGCVLRTGRRVGRLLLLVAISMPMMVKFSISCFRGCVPVPVNPLHDSSRPERSWVFRRKP